MSTELMSFAQAETAAWTVALPAGIARRIVPAGHPRWLAVTSGRVWLTVSDGGDEEGADIWLSRGEGFAIGAGVEVVVEADRDAGFQLVEAAVVTRAIPGRSAWQRAGAVLEAARRSLQLGGVSPRCAG